MGNWGCGEPGVCLRDKKSEIGRILHLKVESGNLKSDPHECTVRSTISTFHFEMQDSSDFRFLVPEGGKAKRHLNSRSDPSPVPSPARAAKPQVAAPSPASTPHHPHPPPASSPQPPAHPPPAAPAFSPSAASNSSPAPAPPQTPAAVAPQSPLRAATTPSAPAGRSNPAPADPAAGSR